MATINVLIVVDVEGALQSGNLADNLYMVDTNKFLGSYREGGNELVTDCNNLDEVNWNVVPVDPGTSVSIDSFSGQIINSKICIPAPIKLPTTTYWTGAIQTQGASPQLYQYSCTLLFEGKTMTFDPFLNVLT